MKKLITLGAIILIGVSSVWYFDLMHEPIESVDELINKGYTFAHNYFGAQEDDYRSIDINDSLIPIDQRIIKKKGILTTPRIDVYTWHYTTHKITIWVGEIKNGEYSIIDAIRYNSKSGF